MFACVVVLDSVVDVVDFGADIVDAGVDVEYSGIDEVDVWVDVADNGVVVGAITLLVRLRTAPSIMHKRIIPVLYCTWQYAPLGRPRTVKYVLHYNSYTVIFTNNVNKRFETYSF